MRPERPAPPERPRRLVLLELLLPPVRAARQAQPERVARLEWQMA
ncbi:MAG: hypothetical protein ABSB33_04030 [Tepidisphaeraceae bacterium]